VSFDFLYRRLVLLMLLLLLYLLLMLLLLLLHPLEKTYKSMRLVPLRDSCARIVIICPARNLNNPLLPLTIRRQSYSKKKISTPTNKQTNKQRHSRIT